MNIVVDTESTVEMFAVEMFAEVAVEVAVVAYSCTHLNLVLVEHHGVPTWELCNVVVVSFGMAVVVESLF